MRVWALVFCFIYKIYGQRHTSTWYNIDNGLPQSSAKAIVKDKYGFIWISTENGIVRYDGSSFITFNNFKVNNIHFGEFIGDPLLDSITILNNFQKNKIIIRNRFPRLTRLYNNKKTSIPKNNGSLQRIANNIITSSFYNDIQYFIQLKNSAYLFKEKNAIIYRNEKEKRLKFPSFSNRDLSSVFVFNEVLFINDMKARKTYSIDEASFLFRKPTLFNDPDTRIYWQQVTIRPSLSIIIISILQSATEPIWH
jgi:hypothetical protein